MNKRRTNVTKGSGRTVNEEFSGYEVCFRHSKILPEAVDELKFEKEEEIIELFNDKVGMLAIGGYIRTSKKIKITSNIECTIQGRNFSNEKSQVTKPNVWHGFGADVRVPIENSEKGTINATVNISGDELETIEVFGLNLGCIDDGDRLRENIVVIDEDSDNDDLDTKTTREWFENFLTTNRTNVPIPVLYYLNHNRPFVVSPENIDANRCPDGSTIVLKACNRPPGRYLPVEHIEERKSNMNFSNHIRHEEQKIIFSDSTVAASDLPDELIDRAEIQHSLQGEPADKASTIHISDGFQLECRACKNYDANLLLNDQRTESQYREDSTSTDSYEDLARELLSHQDPYKYFPSRYGIEFDEWVKNKFGGKCFVDGCNRTADDAVMEIDHTLPKSYLYPIDETATYLCGRHNGEKGTDFPTEYYNKNEIQQLADITGLGNEIHIKSINIDAVKELEKNISWFFEKYLQQNKFQKGKRAATFVSRLQSKLDSKYCDRNLDLVSLYKQKSGNEPFSIGEDTYD